MTQKKGLLGFANSFSWYYALFLKFCPDLKIGWATRSAALSESLNIVIQVGGALEAQLGTIIGEEHLNRFVVSGVCLFEVCLWVLGRNCSQGRWLRY